MRKDFYFSYKGVYLKRKLNTVVGKILLDVMYRINVHTL